MFPSLARPLSSLMCQNEKNARAARAEIIFFFFSLNMQISVLVARKVPVVSQPI